MPSEFPLHAADLANLGLAAKPLFHLEALIHQHIEEGRYPGAQIALARHGQAGVVPQLRQRADRAGEAAGDQRDAVPAVLADQGADHGRGVGAGRGGQAVLHGPVADHLPEFAARGKGEITLHQVMTHQGGFPSNNVTKASWTDHARMRAEVCDFALDWTPGSKLQYHGQAAHLVQAMVIEAVTGQDYRERDPRQGDRAAGAGRRHHGGRAGAKAVALRRHLRAGAARQFRRSSVRRGCRRGGGFATARGMVAFYQMLMAGGRLGTVRLFSPRLIAYVTRNHTGERGDEQMGGIPMHRGLGPHVRGESDRIRGLGTIGAPSVFGHGGVGSSYSWADPTQWGVVHVSDEFRVARSVAFGAAGSGGESGARGDRLRRADQIRFTI